MMEKSKYSAINQIIHDNLDHHSTSVSFEDVWKLAASSKRRWRIRPIITLAPILIATFVAFILMSPPNSMQGDPEVGVNMAGGKIPPKMQPIVDTEEEKEKLAQEGYVTDPSALQLEEEMESANTSKLADVAFFPTLKDFIFNSKSVIKGRVIGTKSFINETNRMAFTKAKVQVVNSYDGQYKKGQIVTVIKPGAIITHYQQIIKNGIDEKFDITEEELEAAKTKMVVADNYGELILPDDQVIAFVNEDVTQKQTGEGMLAIAGPIVKYKNQEIISEAKENYIEDPYSLKEFYSSYELSELENKIQTAMEEKKDYSKEQIRFIAYDALNEEEQKVIIDWESATVTYHSEGRYLNGKKTPDETAVVTFRTQDENPIIIVIKEPSQKVVKIIKR